MLVAESAGVLEIVICAGGGVGERIEKRSLYLGLGCAMVGANPKR